MSLLACGINHKTAPLSIREKIVFSQEVMPRPLHDLISQTKIHEAAILSTCNRTEVYCIGADSESVIAWFSDQQQLPLQSFASHLYLHQDKSAVQHILRVASGLDSMVLGEPQILGQLKTAYQQAHDAGTVGKELGRLFQYVFSVSKQVRTETQVGAHPVSVASAAVDAAKHIFADLTQVKVLCIGVGETIELVSQYLQKMGVEKFWIANRTFARAEKLAQQLLGHAISLDKIAEILPQADMVVTATASLLPIIGKGAVERALKIRKRRLMFMVDLAVPRDIEPEVGELSDVFLYTLDDLQGIIQKNLQGRQQAAQQAEKLIDAHADEYMQSFNLLEAVPLIRAYREKMAELSANELADALQLLHSGAMSPEQLLERLAHRLTNKFLHAPTNQLRQAAYADQKDILQLAEKLFEL